MNRRRLQPPLAPAGLSTDPDTRRRLLADLVKLLGGQVSRPPAASPSTASSPASSPSPTSSPSPASSPSLPPLPPRTKQVLSELLRGKSEKEVAQALGLSPHTVHVHVKTLYTKLGVSSRPELMAKCLAK